MGPPRLLRLALPVAAALLLLLALPPAAAQAQGNVSTWAEPAVLEIDYAKHIPRQGQPAEGQHFVVHVQGSIDCMLGTQRPADVVVEASGTTELSGSQGGQTTVYFRPDIKGFEVEWRSAAGAPTGQQRYVVDAHVTVTAIVEGVPPVRLNGTLQWTGQYLQQGPTDVCHPNGYTWTIHATPHEVILPDLGPGDPDPFPSPSPDRGIPLGPWLALLALAFALAARRHGRDE